MTRGAEEWFVVAIAHRKNSQQERIDPDAMHGLFLIAAGVATHQEISGGNREKIERYGWRGGHPAPILSRRRRLTSASSTDKSRAGQAVLFSRPIFPLSNSVAAQFIHQMCAEIGPTGLPIRQETLEKAVDYVEGGANRQSERKQPKYLIDGSM